MSLQPDFSKGLVPAIIQDASTLKVLMLGYMNEEAYTQTIAEKRVTFFSRSKNRLWTKGETSENYLDVVNVAVDCDQDTILIQANPAGPTCHTGSETCFNESNTDNAAWLDHLKHIIRSRKNASSDSSYTASLFQKGTHKIAQKVGEEAVELVIEALMKNDDMFKGEAADLIFHLLVLLEDRGIGLEEIVKTLQARHQK
ncbi:bifunctional phosphoribosyl-AMP cyclohydrolase/phosphoribosyl-ATP diphosphatase HisIE [Aquirufa sp. OSTEICH-129V]|uniref:Histidine biosynthesis bifunctional protein HisIE n=1 Tax=Aquirufa avitistagni TaxID=3104728 RepID=A0ABW6DEV9_9BACT